MGWPGRILAAVDFTNLMPTVARYSAFLADQYRAPLDILHVLPSTPADASAEEVQIEALRRIHRARELRRQAGLLGGPAARNARISVPVGPPLRTILEQYRRTRPGLVVIGQSTGTRIWRALQAEPGSTVVPVRSDARVPGAPAARAVPRELSLAG
jgi:nucleotide-binding universal stress UspA family protein